MFTWRLPSARWPKLGMASPEDRLSLSRNPAKPTPRYFPERRRRCPRSAWSPPIRTSPPSTSFGRPRACLPPACFGRPGRSGCALTPSRARPASGWPRPASSRPIQAARPGGRAARQRRRIPLRARHTGRSPCPGIRRSPAGSRRANSARGGGAERADTARSGRRKEGSMRLLGQGDELEGGIRHQSEHSLGTDPQVPQIEAGREFLGRGAPLHPFAGRQETLEGEDKVAGDAILAAVHSAGVAGDISADRAVLFGRGIGGVRTSLWILAEA